MRHTLQRIKGKVQRPIEENRKFKRIVVFNHVPKTAGQLKIASTSCAHNNFAHSYGNGQSLETLFDAADQSRSEEK